MLEWLDNVALRRQFGTPLLNLLHTALSLQWEPADRPPATPKIQDFNRALAALSAGPGARPVPDPESLAGLGVLPATLRIRLLDAIHQRLGPAETLPRERWLVAYLRTLSMGCSLLPSRYRAQRLMARAATHATEIIEGHLRERWRAQRPADPRWWDLLFQLFRAGGDHGLLAIRIRSLSGEPASLGRTLARVLLETAANPFAWEPETQAARERLLDLIVQDCHLLPAASPSAYAEGQSGRFLVDAAAASQPRPPEVVYRHPPEAPPPQWWVLDASGGLSRLAELRRGLALGVPPERLHPRLREVGEPACSITVQRLERTLQRGNRREARRPPARPRVVRLVLGLEEVVRHHFAQRWSRPHDTHALDSTFRLQSEMGTRPSPASPEPWDVVEENRHGARLRGSPGPDTAPTGYVVGLVPEGSSQWGGIPELQPALVRWFRRETEGAGADIGLERLPSRPRDCWLRLTGQSRPLAPEWPTLWFPQTEDGFGLLLTVPGLFRRGGKAVARMDDREWSLTLVQLRERGVHFELIEARESTA